MKILSPDLTAADLPPIQSWKGEAFNFENTDVFDIGKAVSLINQHPERFNFCMVALDQLMPQIEGRGHIDMKYAEAISDQDAIRPLLIATINDNQATRLIDGYHRAIRCIQHGQSGAGAWVLTKAQTAEIHSHFSGQVEYIPN